MRMKTVEQLGIDNLEEDMEVRFPENSYTICTNYEIDVSNKIATISGVDYRGTNEKNMVIYVKFHDKEISKHYNGEWNGETYFSHKDSGEGGTDIDYLLKAKILSLSLKI